MSSSTNIYCSEPAIPFLANTVLSQSTYRNKNNNLNESDNWNLEWDLENGIQHSSNDTIFRSGSVICLSRLKNRSREDDTTTSSGDSVGQLARYILLKHLLKNPPLHGLRELHSREERKPNTFIIHPPNFGPFAPESLLLSLLSIEQRRHHHHQQQQQLGYEHKHKPPLSRDEAVKHLDSVQLLPGFDFPTTAQSIGKVSDALQQHQDQHDPLSDSDTRQPPPILFIVTGLDSLAESVVRTSNTVRATAMLTTILRTLTRLARAYASFLSVLLVNTAGIGVGVGVGGTTGSSAGVSSSVDSSTTIERPNEQDQNGYYYHYQNRYDDYGDGGSVQSVFGVAGSGAGAGSGLSLFPGLLTKVLDQGVDVHLLLSTVRRSQIVEVIKDRVGDGTGKWCVWDSCLETGNQTSVQSF